MDHLLEISTETVDLIQSYAKHAGMTPEAYLRSLLPASEKDLGLTSEAPANDFDRDMAAFAESSDNITPYSGSYSREDIYADHN